MGSNTKQRIIGAAISLFADKGYQATTIAEIAKIADANAGSVYFFFPTKQDILLAVLDTYSAGIEHMLLEPAWKDVPDPIDRVFALLDRYRSFLLETECRYGCPYRNTCSRIARTGPGCSATARREFRKVDGSH
jgi:AcrR family transcriptional regulator